MTVAEFLEHARREGWEVFPPEAVVADPVVYSCAPDDLRVFLERCGGVRCAGGVTVGHRVVSAQEQVLGERHPEDRSADWYVIAEEDEATTAERAVIDLSPVRRGRCYEAFWDRFGVAGAMPVVSSSFSDFLGRLARSGGRPYWSNQELALGDAYD